MGYGLRRSCLFSLGKPFLKLRTTFLLKVNSPNMQFLASVKSPFCDDWIMYSLKPHLYSSPNRLSGREPARTASLLLQAGPPETFSESVFSGSYCKWKHLAPTINYPPDWCHTAYRPPARLRQAVDLHFNIKSCWSLLCYSVFGSHELTRRQEKINHTKAVELACSPRGSGLIKVKHVSPPHLVGLTMGSFQDKFRLCWLLIFSGKYIAISAAGQWSQGQHCCSVWMIVYTVARWLKETTGVELAPAVLESIPSTNSHDGASVNTVQWGQVHTLWKHT